MLGAEWAIVLAAGDGTRLRRLSDDGFGNAVPKQFCSLNGGGSLLDHTFNRAQAVVDRERVLTIVASAHAPHWTNELPSVEAHNVVVQPRNRGTAVGILLPLIRIIDRDPYARVVVLPSDHFVAHEATLIAAICRAMRTIERHAKGVALLGIEPDAPDPDLGYIEPDPSDTGHFHDVRRFVEKPSPDDARALIARGALWNSFVIVCRAQCALKLFRGQHTELVDAVGRAGASGARDLSAVYERLPTVDFSRDVVTGQERHLAVTRVPRCGWNDLGTPRRVADTLTRHPDAHACVSDPARSARRPRVNLAERLMDVG